jgi:hypothetical protein
MQPEAAKYLFDVQRAAALIAHFCKGKTGVTMIAAAE